MFAVIRWFSRKGREVSQRFYVGFSLRYFAAFAIKINQFVFSHTRILLFAGITCVAMRDMPAVCASASNAA